MDLKVFLKENNKQNEIVEYVASERFKDSDNNPIKWKIKVLKNKEMEVLKNRYIIKTKNSQGLENINFKAQEFTKAMVIECIVYPNLNDKELQDNYEVMGAYSLLQEILTVGELNALEIKINELHNYEAKEKKIVDDIKNY